MTDQTNFSRRETLKVIAATGALVGGSGTVLGGVPEDSPLALQHEDYSVCLYDTDYSENEYPMTPWEGHGRQHAVQDCDGDAYWKWVLTPGGPVGSIEEAEEIPKLVVQLDDGTEETYGELDDGDQGAVHFYVEKDGGGEVECAGVVYEDADGDPGEENPAGENALLTFGEGGCSDGEDGDSENGDSEGGDCTVPLSRVSTSPTSAASNRSDTIVSLGPRTHVV